MCNACVAFFGMVCSCAATAFAQSGPLADGNRNTGWAMDLPVSPHQTSSAFVGVAGNGDFQGRLDLNLVYNPPADAPLYIGFQKLPIAEDNGFGLRVDITFHITNNTQVPWTSMEFRGVDGNPTSALPAAVRDHPYYAHFHQMTASSGQMPYGGGPFTNIASYRWNAFAEEPTPGSNGSFKVVLSGGTLAPGQSADFTNFSLHQFNFNNDYDMAGMPVNVDPRNFLLSITPNIPSPGAGVMLAIGGLVMSRRRRE